MSLVHLKFGTYDAWTQLERNDGHLGIDDGSSEKPTFEVETFLNWTSF